MIKVANIRCNSYTILRDIDLLYLRGIWRGCFETESKMYSFVFDSTIFTDVAKKKQIIAG